MTIVCSPGTCGGDARIFGTRITVRDIVLWVTEQGLSFDEIVDAYPWLKTEDCVDAMRYFKDHTEEIYRQIAENKQP